MKMSTALYWYDEDNNKTHEIRFDAVVNSTFEDSISITEHPIETGAATTDHARDEPARFTIEGIVSAVISVGQEGVVQRTSMVSYDELTQTGMRQQTLDIPVPPSPPQADQSLSVDTSTRQPRVKRPQRTRQVDGASSADTSAPREEKKYVIEVPVYTKGTKTAQITISERVVPKYRPREIYESLLQAKTKKAMFVISTNFRDYYDMQLERVVLLRSAEDGTSGRFQLNLKQVFVRSTEVVSVPIPAEARGAVSKNKGKQATKEKEPPPEARSLLHGMLFRTETS